MPDTTAPIADRLLPAQPDGALPLDTTGLVFIESPGSGGNFPAHRPAALPENRTMWDCDPLPARVPGKALPFIHPSFFALPMVKYATSFHLDPQRGFLITRPWSALTNVAGINMNGTRAEEWDAMLKHLWYCGIRHIRMPQGWSTLTSAHPHTINNEADLIDRLQTAKKYGIRPLILLEFNHAAPCPMGGFYLNLVVDAKAGDKTVTIPLDAAARLVPGLSGISYLTPAEYRSCETLFETIDLTTGVCTLTRGMPRDVPATEQLTVHVLQYAPLQPGTAGGKIVPQALDTIFGWAEYISRVLCAAQKAGVVVDLEICNEPTFGSDFILYPEQYYDPLPFPMDQPNSWTVEVLLDLTIRIAEAHGAGTVNGFTSQNWHWSGYNIPPGLKFNTRHPYKNPYRGGYDTVPDPTAPGYKPVNCPLVGPDGEMLTQVNTQWTSDVNGTWYDIIAAIPPHVVNFPEEPFSMLNSGPECLLADVSPFPFDRFLPRGANVRAQYPDGTTAPPVGMLMTEIGLSPYGICLVEDFPGGADAANAAANALPAPPAGVQTNAAPLAGTPNPPGVHDGLVYFTTTGDARNWIHAKMALRYYMFSAKVGVERVYLFAVGDTNLGWIDDSLVSAPTPRASPAFLAWVRMITCLKPGTITTPRAIGVSCVSDNHNATELPEYKGTKATYHREHMAICPFQTSDTSFAVGIYVKHKNVGQIYDWNKPEDSAGRYSMPEEVYTFILQGIAPGATVQCYDPMLNVYKAVSVSWVGTDCHLIARITDYPRLFLFTKA